MNSGPILIAGPTAVGKSEVAMLLAEKVGGEIISVDSMQVYRGLDIGTAKPSSAEQARVKHHLIDVVGLTEEFDAAKFAALAHAAVAEIQSRGKVPILCGGTGLYFKAFVDGVGEAPASDAKLRAELEKTPIAKLLEELKDKDLVTFEKIDKQNLRRVVRAVEVIRLTGKPFSEQKAEWRKEKESKAGKAQEDTSPQGRALYKSFFALAREVNDLRSRADARVDKMFSQGLVEETRRLLEQGLEQNKTAMQAIGYRQVVEHLRGERGLPETIELVKSKTRQFAKRQMTWFKGQFELEWVEIGKQESAETIVGKISQRFTKEA